MSNKTKRTNGYKAAQPARLPSVGSATAPIPDIDWDYEMRCERDNVSEFYKDTTLKTVLSIKRAQGEDIDKYDIYKGLVNAELLRTTLNGIDEVHVIARVNSIYSRKSEEIKQRLAKEQGLDSDHSIINISVMDVIVAEVEEEGIAAAHRKVLPGQGPFPPVTISRNGERDFTIDDGNHRIYIWKKQGFNIIPASIIDYTREKRLNCLRTMSQ